MKSDLEIARNAEMLPITEIAARIGLEEDEIELYGRYKAKVSLQAKDRLADRPDAKYAVVTAITPPSAKQNSTPSDLTSSNRIGQKTINCIRQPSLASISTAAGRRRFFPMCQWKISTCILPARACGAWHTTCWLLSDAHLLHGTVGHPFKIPGL